MAMKPVQLLISNYGHIDENTDRVYFEIYMKEPFEMFFWCLYNFHELRNKRDALQKIGFDLSKPLRDQFDSIKKNSIFLANEDFFSDYRISAGGSVTKGDPIKWSLLENLYCCGRFGANDITDDFIITVDPYCDGEAIYDVFNEKIHELSAERIFDKDSMNGVVFESEIVK